MKSPYHKPVEFHKDALSTYKKQIKPNKQLRTIFDGLKWLISNNHTIGTSITKNYYIIKSSENIPAWHKKKFDLDSLPPITVLYSVWEDSIIIEGIHI